MGATPQSAPPAPGRPRARAIAAGGRHWYIDEIVVIVFALFGFVGGVFLPHLITIQPIITSFMLSTGLAALTYRFLGGIQGASFTMGSLKIGGTLGAMVGIAMLINHALVAEMPPTQGSLHQAYHVTGTVIDNTGAVVSQFDPGDITVDPGGIKSGFSGEFQVTFVSWPDFNGQPQFPILHVKHGAWSAESIPLKPVAASGFEIPLGSIHLNKQISSSPEQTLTPASAAGETASLTPTPEKKP
jgi:hypothetical protein